MSFTEKHPLFEAVKIAKAESKKSQPSPLSSILSTSEDLRYLQVEQIVGTSTAPWIDSTINVQLAKSKEIAEENHRRDLASAATTEIFCYTDGSLMDGRAGAGMSLRIWNEIERKFVWLTKYSAMGKGHTVYAAELHGIGIALDSLAELLPELKNIYNFSATHVRICVDNQSAASNACNDTRAPGQELRVQNDRKMKKLRAESILTSIEFVWIPSHVEIEGNEIADKMARKGALLDPLNKNYRFNEHEDGEVKAPLRISISALKAEYQEILMNEWNQEWRYGPTGRALRAIDPNPPSLNTLRIHGSRNRRHNSLLTQLRTDASNLSASLFKRHLIRSSDCLCGERETRQHYFLNCKLHLKPRLILRTTLEIININSLNLSTLLTNPLATHATIEFIQNTGRFIEYHHHLIEKTERKARKEDKKKKQEKEEDEEREQEN